MDSIHLWIIPLVLVGLKVLYDILPKVAFFGIVAAIAIGYFANEKLATKRIERAAKELEESADSFLDEIDSADKVKKEKDAKKKASKELQRQEKLRAQEKQKVIPYSIDIYRIFIIVESRPRIIL